MTLPFTTHDVSYANTPGYVRDEYNSLVPSWADASWTDTRGVLSPNRGEESPSRGAQVIREERLFLDADDGTLTITASSRVRVDDTVYEVSSPPSHWKHPVSGDHVHHIELTLRLTEGAHA